jgi:NAD(P)-dependent dehydrogenase (short-subunit alcohol dehydrogenase family)
VEPSAYKEEEALKQTIRYTGTSFHRHKSLLIPIKFLGNTVVMAESSIILITGGNTGIGYESVKALYASTQPHIILMGSRSLDKAKDAISKLQSEVPESKSEVVPIQIDIENDASIEKAFKVVENKYGHVDALINNAGMRCPFFYRTSIY